MNFLENDFENLGVVSYSIEMFSETDLHYWKWRKKEMVVL
jgi:hypothetical protein